MNNRTGKPFCTSCTFFSRHTSNTEVGVSFRVLLFDLVLLIPLSQSEEEGSKRPKAGLQPEATNCTAFLYNSGHRKNNYMALCFENYTKGRYFCSIFCPFFLHFISFSPISFFVPTIDTKVTEYLCSGWVFFFFFRQISTF